MLNNSSNMFKKLNVPTKQDKNYLLKYRSYSSQCIEQLKNIKFKQSNDTITAAINMEDSKESTELIENKPFNYRTLLCKFFLVNACTRGDNCAYSHDTTQFPCKAFFLRQNCKRKNCMFSHNSDTLDKLDEPFEETQDAKIESPFF